MPHRMDHGRNASSADACGRNGAHSSNRASVTNHSNAALRTQQLTSDPKCFFHRRNGQRGNERDLLQRRFVAGLFAAGLFAMDLVVKPIKISQQPRQSRQSQQQNFNINNDKCRECNGTGEMEAVVGGHSIDTKCIYCGGSGKRELQTK
jgi:hypothetical protein